MNLCTRKSRGRRWEPPPTRTPAIPATPGETRSKRLLFSLDEGDHTHWPPLRESVRRPRKSPAPEGNQVRGSSLHSHTRGTKEVRPDRGAHSRPGEDQENTIGTNDTNDTRSDPSTSFAAFVFISRRRAQRSRRTSDTRYDAARIKNTPHPSNHPAAVHVRSLFVFRYSHNTAPSGHVCEQ